jgi:hypothetical protein
MSFIRGSTDKISKEKSQGGSAPINSTITKPEVETVQDSELLNNEVSDHFTYTNESPRFTISGPKPAVMKAVEKTLARVQEEIVSVKELNASLKGLSMNRDNPQTPIQPTACIKCGACCVVTACMCAVCCTDAGPTIMNKLRESEIKIPYHKETFDELGCDIVQFGGAFVNLMYSGDALEETDDEEPVNFSQLRRSPEFYASRQRRYARRIATLSQVASYVYTKYGEHIYEFWGFDLIGQAEKTVNSEKGEPIPVIKRFREGFTQHTLSKGEKKKTISLGRESSTGQLIYETVNLLDNLSEAALSEGWQHFSKLCAGMFVLGTLGDKYEEKGMEGIIAEVSDAFANKEMTTLEGCVDGLKFFCNIVLDYAYPDITSRFHTGSQDVDSNITKIAGFVNHLKVDMSAPPQTRILDMISRIAKTREKAVTLQKLSKNGLNRARLGAAVRQIDALTNDIQAFLRRGQARYEPFYVFGQGLPGTGKSVIAQVLSLLMHAWLDLERIVYTYGLNTKHHNGAKTMSTEVCFDDVFQRAEFPAGEDPVTDIIQMKNTTPFQWRKAELSEKENSWMYALIMNQTENEFMPPWLKKVITTPGAFARRPDFIWTTRVDPRKWPDGLSREEKAKTTGIHPDTQFQIKVCPMLPKVVEAKGKGKRGTKSSDTQQTEIDYDLKPDPAFGDRWLTRNEFLAVLKERLLQHFENQEKKFAKTLSMTHELCEKCKGLKEGGCLCELKSPVVTGVKQMFGLDLENFSRIGEIRNVFTMLPIGRFDDCLELVQKFPGNTSKIKYPDKQEINNLFQVVKENDDPLDIFIVHLSRVFQRILKKGWQRHASARDFNMVLSGMKAKAICCWMVANGCSMDTTCRKHSVLDEYGRVLATEGTRITWKKVMFGDREGVRMKTRPGPTVTWDFIMRGGVTIDMRFRNKLYTSQDVAEKRYYESIRNRLSHAPYDEQYWKNCLYHDVTRWKDNPKNSSGRDKLTRDAQAEMNGFRFALEHAPHENVPTAEELKILADIAPWIIEGLCTEDGKFKPATRFVRALKDRLLTYSGGYNVDMREPPEDYTPETDNIGEAFIPTLAPNRWKLEPLHSQDPQGKRLKKYLKSMRSDIGIVNPDENLRTSLPPLLGLQDFKCDDNDTHLSTFLTSFTQATRADSWHGLTVIEPDVLPQVFYYLQEFFIWSRRGFVPDLAKYLDEMEVEAPTDRYIVCWAAGIYIKYLKMMRFQCNRPPLHEDYFVLPPANSVYLDRVNAITRNVFTLESGKGAKTIPISHFSVITSRAKYHLGEAITNIVPTSSTNPWFAAFAPLFTSIFLCCTPLGLGTTAMISTGAYLTSKAAQNHRDRIEERGVTAGMDFSLGSLVANTTMGLLMAYGISRMAGTSLVQKYVKQSSMFSLGKGEKVEVGSKRGDKPMSWVGKKAGVEVQLDPTKRTQAGKVTLEGCLEQNLLTAQLCGHNTTVLQLDANWAIMTYHAVPEEESTMTLLRIDKEGKPFFSEVVISKSRVVRIGGDTALFVCSHGGSKSCIVDYFPQSKPKGSTCVTLATRRDGFLNSKKRTCNGLFYDYHDKDDDEREFYGLQVQPPTLRNYLPDLGYSIDGDCGSVWTAQLGQSPYIAALHRGSFSEGVMVGEVLTQNQLEEGRKKFAATIWRAAPPFYDKARKNAEKAGIIPIGPVSDIHPKSVANFLNLEGPTQVLGSVPNSGHLDRSRIKDSPLKPVAEELFGDEVDKNEVPDMAKKSYNNVLNVGDQPIRDINLRTLDIVTQAYLDHVLSCIPAGTGDYMLSKKEVEELLDWSTGAGLGYGTTKRKYAEKYDYHGEIPPHVWAESDRELQDLAEGRSCEAIYTTCLKDELRKKGKQARVFMPGQFHHLVTQYRLYGRLLQVMAQHPFTFRLGLGLDLQGLDGDDLFEHLNIDGAAERPGTGIGTDYKDWDLRLHYHIRLASMWVFNKCNEHLFSMSEKEKKISDTFSPDNCTNFLVIREVLYCVMTVLTSGTLLTGAIGGTGNEITAMYAYYEKNQEIESYFHKTASANMGDDKHMVVSEPSKFDAFDLKETADKLGMVVTSYDKGELKRFCNFWDMDWLSRKPVYFSELQRVVWCISPTSLCKAMQAYSPSTTASLEDQLYSTIESVLYLAWPYGRKTFITIQDKLRAIVEEKNLPLSRMVQIKWETLIEELPKGNRKTCPKHMPIENPWNFSVSRSVDFFRFLRRTFFPQTDLLESIENEVTAPTDAAIPGQDNFAPDPSLDLGNFNERWVITHSIELQPLVTVDLTVSPLESYLLNPSIKEKIASWNAITGTVEIRLSCTAPTTTYGTLMVSFTPAGQKEVRPYWLYNAHTESTKPGFLFNIGKEESTVDFMLPTVWHKTAYNRSLQDQNYHGKLRIQSLTNIDEVFPKGKKFLLRIMVRMPVMHLSQSTFRKHTKASAKLLQVSKVADTVSKFPIPYLATVSKIVAEGTDAIGSTLRNLGFSRPNTGPMLVFSRREEATPGSTTDTPVSIPKLSLSCLAEVSIDPSICGAPSEDEMILENLAGRNGLIGVYEISQAMSSGAKIMSVNVNPGVMIKTPEGTYIPPCGFASLPFKVWNGDMILTFHASCASMHALKTIISHDSAGDYSGLETHKAHSVIWDIKESEEMEFRVRWCSERGILLVRNDYGFHSAEGDFDPTKDNGVVNWSVFSPMLSPGDTDKISVAVFVRFENIFLSNPDGTILTYLMSSLKTSITQWDNALNPLYEEIGDVPGPPDGTGTLPSDLGIGEPWGLQPVNLVDEWPAILVSSDRLSINTNDVYDVGIRWEPNETIGVWAFRNPTAESNWIALEIVSQSGGSVTAGGVVIDILSGIRSLLLVRVDAMLAGQNSGQVYLTFNGTNEIDVKAIYTQPSDKRFFALSARGQGLLGLPYNTFPLGQEISTTLGGAPSLWTGVEVGLSEFLELSYPMDDPGRTVTIWFANGIRVNGVDYRQQLFRAVESIAITGSRVLKIENHSANNEYGLSILFAIVSLGDLPDIATNRRLKDIFGESKRRGVHNDDDEEEAERPQRNKRSQRIDSVSLLTDNKSKKIVQSGEEFYRSILRDKGQPTGVKIFIPEATVGHRNFSHNDLKLMYTGDQCTSFRALGKRFIRITSNNAPVMFQFCHSPLVTSPAIHSWIMMAYLGVRGGVRVSHQTGTSISLGNSFGAASAAHYVSLSPEAEAVYSDLNLFQYCRGDTIYPDAVFRFAMDGSGWVRYAWAEDTHCIFFLGLPLFPDI